MSLHKMLFLAAVIIWIAFVFNLSAQGGKQSNELSGEVTEVIVKVIEKVAPNTDFDIKSFNLIIRKYAHFIAYLILGILVISALRRNGAGGYQSIVLTFLLCVVFALSDEVHQLFVLGRNAQLKDVIIDSAGASIGIILYVLLSRLFKRKHKKQLNKEG